VSAKCHLQIINYKHYKQLENWDAKNVRIKAQFGLASGLWELLNWNKFVEQLNGVFLDIETKQLFNELRVIQFFLSYILQDSNHYQSSAAGWWVLLQTWWNFWNPRKQREE
jgi:hypothetical protein